MGDLRIGTSGYQYKHWKGIFYPEGLKVAAWIRDALAEGKDVYAYFNNDIGGHAIRNALTLRSFVSK